MTRSGRGGRYWRSRLVVRSDAGDDPDEFRDVGRISLVSIIGPLLALPRRWHLPVILEELAAGIVLGTTGSDACRRTTRRSVSWLTLGSR
jgi:hypothetical protein